MKEARPRLAAELVQVLDLAPHPEGGFFREVFRSERTVPSESGERSSLTVIYFLLTADSFSAWHRLRSDETWHFAIGEPATIEMFDENAGYRRTEIGPDGPWLAVIPAETTFAAHVDVPGGYALLTCCVAPGFDFADFTLVAGEALAAAFPEHTTLVQRYARANGATTLSTGAASAARTASPKTSHT